MNSLLYKTIMSMLLSLVFRGPPFWADSGRLKLRDHETVAPLQSQSQVFQLKLSSVTGGEGPTYSLAFVVDRAGLLITDYHAVASALIAPTGYRLALSLDNRDCLAKIISFDIMNDLAIIQVPHKFSDSFRIANKSLALHDRVHVIGLTNNSLITATSGEYMGEVKSGPVTKSVFRGSNALHGAAVVNMSGELVGLQSEQGSNRRELFQNDSAITPVTQMSPVILSARERVRMPASRGRVDEMVPQINSGLAPWLKNWELKKENKLQQVGRFELSGLPSGMVCATVNRILTEPKATIPSLSCKTNYSFPYSIHKTGPAVSFAYSVLPKVPSSSPFSAEVNENALTTELKSRSKLAFEKSAQEIVAQPAFSCRHEFVRTRRGFNSFVEYCVTAANSTPETYDFILTASSVTKGAPLLAELRLQGFTSGGIKSVSELFLEGIREKSSP
jgi:hypothetical protein